MATGSVTRNALEQTECLCCMFVHHNTEWYLHESLPRTGYSGWTISVMQTLRWPERVLDTATFICPNPGHGSELHIIIAATHHCMYLAIETTAGGVMS